MVYTNNNGDLVILAIVAIKRNISVIAIIGVTAFVIVLTIAFFNFTLFPREDTPMAQINLKGRIIDIKFVQSGATTQDVVQVTMKNGSTNERVISNITRMNFLAGYQLINDTTLELTLKDTVFASNKAHSFKIHLPN